MLVRIRLSDRIGVAAKEVTITVALSHWPPLYFEKIMIKAYCLKEDRNLDLGHGPRHMTGSDHSAISDQ